MFGVYAHNKMTGQTEKAAGPFASLAEAEARKRELGITAAPHYDLFTDEDMPADHLKPATKEDEANQK